MCDCYGEPCKVCGKMLPLHLGDYKTQRWEIVTLCEDHIKLFPHLRRVIWSKETSKEPLLAILTLTENAWRYRFSNNPNNGGSKILSIPVHSCVHCHKLFDTKKEAKDCEVQGRKFDKEHDEWWKKQWKK